MPLWVQYVLATAALVAAFGVIWSKVLKPVARFITTSEEMLPLLITLTEAFKDNPNAFQVLSEVASEFRSDSGTTLRDVVNRLEAAAIENKTAADALKVGVEADRLLAERDRKQLQEQLVSLDRLLVRADAAAATGIRMEKAATQVANDLAASHARADATSNSEPGAAVDAAVQNDKSLTI